MRSIPRKRGIFVLQSNVHWLVFIYFVSSECKPIDYPTPKAPLSTDILTSVALTGTNHTEDQPVHLRLPPGPGPRSAHVKKNIEEYAGLLGRACPASVYEYVDAEGSEGSEEGGGYAGKKLVINSQVRLPSFAIFS